MGSAARDAGDAVWDAIVLGAGPAGLSAALWLARYRRRVLVLHDGSRRNARARRIHGYLGLDEVRPAELVRRGTEQVRVRGGAVRRARVASVRRVRGTFRVSVADALGRRARFVARSLVVATGIRDEVPPWARPLYGDRVHHCSDCDGPEHTGRTVLVEGSADHVVPYALRLLRWARRIHLVVDRPPRIPRAHRERLVVHVARVRSLRGEDPAGPLAARLDDGERVACDGAFFLSHAHPRTEAVAPLRLAERRGGLLRVDARQRTSVEGVYAAGDVTHGSQLAIVAAAEGAMAALHLSRWLDRA